MPKFYTMHNRPPRASKAFDNKYMQKYKIVRDKKTGQRKLVEDEVLNIYEKIQEGAEELTLKNLIKKYDINTIEKLKFDKEKIIDLTNIPENLIDSMNIISNAKEVFERQSKETKNQFNNDWRQFIAASEDGKLKNYINQKLATTSIPAQGTTTVPAQETTSVTAQGTTSVTAQGTTSVPAQGTTSVPAQGTTYVTANNYQGVNLNA